MLTLVHPRPPAQPPPPRGKRAPALKLTAEEAHHARGAMRNIKQAFGSWRALSQAIGVPVKTLHHAMRKSRGSAILFLRVAQVGRLSFDDMIRGKIGAVGRCSCGAQQGR